MEMPSSNPNSPGDTALCSVAGFASTASIKPLVFGGIDGLTTTLALIWSSIAAGEQVLTSNAVMIVGVANLLATATSMGIGDYMGTLAEHEASAQSRNAEERLSVKSVSTLRAVRLAALRSGLTMFASFVIFGGLPLIALLPIFGDISARRTVATLLCVVSFLALGVARAQLSGETTMGGVLRTSFKMLAMGSLAAFVSFGASKVIAFLLLGTTEIPGGG